jgi:hypothetical protein
MLYLLMLFAASLFGDTMSPPTREEISGDWFVPQGLSSFSYVITPRDTNFGNPLETIQNFYNQKNIPALILYADFVNGVKTFQKDIFIGNSHTHEYRLAALALAEETMAKINPARPERGASGVLIVLKGNGVIQAITVAIPNFTIASGPIIDHNAYVEIFRGITHQIPDNL